MQIDNSRGVKNALFGILSQILTFTVGIIIPRLVLINLGSETNGLMNSVGNILGYMSLLEAGIGVTALQALYKPCAQNDHATANSIMAATDYFYRRTGKIYFIIVCFLSVGYTFGIQTELSRLDVFIVVLLSGLSGAINYFFQGKYRILLSAEGKSYVNTNIVTIIQVFSSIAKALLLFFGFGVVAIQISAFTLSLLQMLIYLFYMKHHYPWLDVKVKPDLDAIKQRNAVLIHQISSMIFSNTDVLLLTFFTSLKEVSVYTMYAMIYGMVKSMAVVFYSSYTYALGQTYNLDKCKFLRMFNAFETVSLAITFSLYCICRVLINPFLSLYTAGVNDIQYVDPVLPWLFAVFYLLHNGRTSSCMVIEFAKHFEETKWHTILEAIINLIVSLICVIHFGIYGVVIGTIAALLYRTNDMIIYASRLLKRSCWITYRRWLLNMGFFFGCSFLLDRIIIHAEDYFQLLLSAIIISIIVFMSFIIINVISERDNTKYIFEIIKSIIRSIFKKTKSYR